MHQQLLQPILTLGVTDRVSSGLEIWRKNVRNAEFIPIDCRLTFISWGNRGEIVEQFQESCFSNGASLALAEERPFTDDDAIDVAFQILARAPTLKKRHSAKKQRGGV